MWHLTALGEVKPLNIRVKGFSGSGGFVAVSRQKCVFAPFQAPPGTGGAAANAAARVFAANGSPFKNSDVLICRRNDRFGIWWWDKTWAEAALAAAGHANNASILPEPFFRQAGIGPQLVRSGTGYSSQIWDNGFLIADQWARSTPDRDQWADFLRVADQAWVEVPMVSASPFVSANPYLGTIQSRYSLQTLGRVAGGLGMAIIAGTTLFFLGQAVRLYAENIKLTQQITGFQSQNHSRGELFKAKARDLNALKSEFEQPDPLEALKAAQEVLLPFGYKLTTFKFDGKSASFELPIEASVGVDLIAEELDASPHFDRVEPVLDRSRKKLVFTMNLKAVKSTNSTQGPK